MSTTAGPKRPDAAPPPEGSVPASLRTPARDDLDGWLRDAFRAGRAVPFQARLRTECFILGCLCTRAGRPPPAWLNDAPLWAHGAALNGHRAYTER
jgi:hypothetical protein